MANTESNDRMVVRPAEQRGKTERDWLESFHTFSFGSYRDPDWTRWGSLRVLNEDYIAPDSGFPFHRHENMEIITYPVSGAVAHEDSSGGDGVVRTGEVQRMTAGSGIRHSEMNASKTEPLHLLQIWIFPATEGLEPAYDTVKLTSPEEVQNQLDLIGGPDPGEDAVQIHQNARVYRGHVEPEQTVHYSFDGKRLGWLQLISGELRIDNNQLSAGDGAGIRDSSEIALTAIDTAHFLFFDLRGR